MSEYIVDGAEPNSTVLKSITENGYEHERWLPVREEIVRCRDCAYSFDMGSRCRKWRGQDCFENSIPEHVEPDCFCSFGERREP